ncbi:hypothetical protein M011DRAFT_463012 [Sporormia fimetaria CBS 119925]|uniref:Uncharacterized protein n=1 Tax=Sporormia fimetaria CBS 119925 TaxID=1340428 RepID=A0A6A6UWI3_9PLEO|nr:hypothetical protein M011DRAFT_463012 [Sporormia fimetaria CBS 119925]
MLARPGAGEIRGTGHPPGAGFNKLGMLQRASRRECFRAYCIRPFFAVMLWSKIYVRDRQRSGWISFRGSADNGEDMEHVADWIVGTIVTWIQEPVLQEVQIGTKQTDTQACLEHSCQFGVIFQDVVDNVHVPSSLPFGKSTPGGRYQFCNIERS